MLDKTYNQQTQAQSSNLQPIISFKGVRVRPSVNILRQVLIMMGTFSKLSRLKWKCIVAILCQQTLASASQHCSSNCAALIPVGLTPSHRTHSKRKSHSLPKSIWKRVHADGDRFRTFANLEEDGSEEETFKQLKISFVTGNRMKVSCGIILARTYLLSRVTYYWCATRKYRRKR